MSLYVIGIGGTGAKCIEALTHVCAAGLMPEQEVFALFVDPDRANGSLDRARVTLQQYAHCNKLSLGKTPFFRSTITTPEQNDLWSPINNQQATLGQTFNYNVLTKKEPEATKLFDVLFSERERTTRLDRGFRGHPSIGAAVLAQTIQLGQEDPWRTLRDRVRRDARTGKKVNVFLFGSIFGGTGAAGFPTIARLIRDELKTLTADDNTKTNGSSEERRSTVRLGGALVLPYFSFIPQDGNKELRASSEDFLMSTQAALKSYHRHHGNLYDRVYLLGDSMLSPVEHFSTGAEEQRNEPHFIELYAALAAVDFCSWDGKGQPFPMIARNESDKLTWRDLPDSETVRTRLGQLARFAFSYRFVYSDMLKDIHDRGKAYRAPWYINYFERKSVRLDNEALTTLDEVREYAESLLAWLHDLHTSAEQQTIELINWQAFIGDRGEGLRFDPEGFGKLVYPIGKVDPNALNSLWEKVSAYKVQDEQARDLGRFIRALYECCAVDRANA